MAIQLPPIPNNPITDTHVWRDWFFKVSQILVQSAAIAWTSLSFTGSNLLDIQTRQHNALQDMQGGVTNEYYHLTSAQRTSVTSLGTMSSQNTTSYSTTGADTTYAYRANNLSDLASATTARSNLGLGTMATQNTTSYSTTGTDTTYAYRSNNLSDLASASSARTNLGLGSIAVENVGISATITTAKVTAGGANGSMTFVNGILTAQTQAT